MATGSIDPKDPLASCNIPQIIEDKRLDYDAKAVHYKRGSLLGKGGFAKVFVGTLLPGNTQYALKIVAKANLQKVRAQQKLQTEIKIHKSLRHVNVVKFERFFDDANYYYIVMELCDFNSMSELMKRRKKLSEPEARYYMIQIVESLRYLHNNLVIHRDLKVGNLFIDGNMRIKVGDFGLATKLTYPDERRKTICGTPNYIAPEILEGKNGHSFEVDIWSTGVILYTLLVGKPPFESKDVKSTYKRILSNSYAFPDHTYVGLDAKSLIRKILQTRPEQRPSLSQIAEHAFFTNTSLYTPTVLPDSALHECPKSMMSSDFSAPCAKEVELARGKAENAVPLSLPVTNENDPSAMNRLNIAKKPESSNMVKKEVPLMSGNQSNEHARTARSSAPAAQRPTTTATFSNSIPNVGNGVVIPITSSISSQQSTAMPKAGARNQTPAATVTRDYASNYSSQIDKPRQSSAGQPLSSITTSRTSSRASSTAALYSQKFDIYVDTKVSTATNPGQQQHVGRKRESSTVFPLSSSVASNSSDQYIEKPTKDVGSKRSVACDGLSSSTMPTPTSGAAAKKKLYDEMELDRMQTDLQHVQLVERAQLLGSAEGPKRGNTAEAWSLRGDSAPVPVAMTSGPVVLSRANAYHHHEPAVCSEPEPMCIGTPTEQIRSSKELKPLGTLETMHDMLNSSFSAVDQLVSGNPSAKTKWSQELPVESLSDKSPDLVAKVWVVSYVDYTSKYGLGFLFNTGSAGVFFNDSTKIVLSADGRVFQYTERRRRDSSTGSEHSSQKHLITCYPPELQKKVTLLKHFRNYLVDQRRTGNQQSIDDNPSADSEAAVGAKSSGLLKDGAISDGACAAIKFGLSSTKYKAAEENNDRNHQSEIPGSPISDIEAETDDYDKEMPFLKKWVRTKHAILFRISNRTVQVVFYDKSEVLLSSEARMITYVSKVGVRSEHSLDDVMLSGRLDIAKRLKYTKDIMYRLINTQSK